MKAKTKTDTNQEALRRMTAFKRAIENGKKTRSEVQAAADPYKAFLKAIGADVIIYQLKDEILSRLADGLTVAQVAEYLVTFHDVIPTERQIRNIVAEANGTRALSKKSRDKINVEARQAKEKGAFNYVAPMSDDALIMVGDQSIRDRRKALRPPQLLAVLTSEKEFPADSVPPAPEYRTETRSSSQDRVESGGPLAMETQNTDNQAGQEGTNEFGNLRPDPTLPEGLELVKQGLLLVPKEWLALIPGPWKDGGRQHKCLAGKPIPPDLVIPCVRKNGDRIPEEEILPYALKNRIEAVEMARFMLEQVAKDRAKTEKQNRNYLGKGAGGDQA